MRFNYLASLLLLSGVFTFTAPTSAAMQETSSAEPTTLSPDIDEQLLCTEPFCLWVQPQVCVTENAPAVCEETVSVSWRSETPLNACLAFDEKVLTCWRQEEVGTWLGDLTWFGDEILVLFTVEDSELNAAGEWRERPRRTGRNSRQQFLNSVEILASTEMQIQSLFPKARRRLGSPWSVF
ncbi:DUF3019 domain-containing protein [Aliidiomarina haloalkalitolerans]|uniref:DUF3019 domain-containing protein n=1 Tax=Aliidiomarina haloalkalitolerans TaxID=859059 RepID=A0A432VRG4_9GAMM|nr:DUF3019 domain-containing protein [Aliidiomarina haloalkalitolerans]RUO18906.1 hypothetical protein CWE06_09950 [Aliidiomarina haloalkalitolerans]